MPASPFPPPACPPARSPAQVLEEESQRVVVGGGQRAHQVTHTAAALGLVLQLWGREGWTRRGERMELTPSACVGPARGRPLRSSPPTLPSPALTDGRNELGEVREGEEGLGQLSKEELQGAGDNVDILPASIVQVQTLLCGKRGGRKRRSTPLPAFWAWSRDWGRSSPWSTL